MFFTPKSNAKLPDWSSDRRTICGFPGGTYIAPDRLSASVVIRTTGVVLRGTESLLTHRWRKPDSNHRSRVTPPSFRRRLCHLLDSLHADRSARTRTDITRMPAASRGTDGSNPASSNGESASSGISASHDWKPAFRASVRAMAGSAFGRDGHRPATGATGD